MKTDSKHHSFSSAIVKIINTQKLSAVSLSITNQNQNQETRELSLCDCEGSGLIVGLITSL